MFFESVFLFHHEKHFCFWGVVHGTPLLTLKEYLECMICNRHINIAFGALDFFFFTIKLLFHKYLGIILFSCYPRFVTM